ncbi:MAG TPA: BadF/BadG/BcrA/BcrD ATPase family protein [Candidatus Limnocylindrales bacterium]|nr:BadF/BadG/BcrA/BcrD ATPase family protein [Candidatus Limnocylindrales bacterium]
MSDGSVAPRRQAAGSARGSVGPAAVLGVDGGNLKTDVVLVGCDGAVLAAVRGGSISHQAVGLRTGRATLLGLVAAAASRAGLEDSIGPLVDVAAFTVAGADFRRHETMLRREYSGLGIARTVLVRNDAFAPLRAGTNGVGIGVICGSGMNCAGVSPTGRTARFPALGDISGDWGGAGSLGVAALWHAVRGRDGRGPATILERLVPEHFALSRPLSVTVALEERRIPHGRLRELAPIVFAAAGDGDVVARSIVDRQADEIVAMAATIGRRLGMRRAGAPVVLAGGVTRTDEAGFWARVRSGVADALPGSPVSRLDAPPVLGAALIGLDTIALSADARAAAEARLRRELTHERIETLEPFERPAPGRGGRSASRRRR